MCSIMIMIGPEHLELFALELGKIAEVDFVYTLASTNINQLVPNLARMFVTIRSRMSLFMDVIRLELSKLSALEVENLPYLTLFTLYSICKYKPISTKPGHNIYDHNISDEFNYDYNRFRTSKVICP